jgi:putative NADH-flavin reductase
MKITVFGASGKTGTLLVDEALTSGHAVTAYVRKPESMKSEHPNLKVVAGYLNEKEKLKSVISGSDACISTLGGASLTKHSREISVPLADHNTNESRIGKSHLHWTIVRPGGLTNGVKTGNLKHGYEATKIRGSLSISRSSVAAFLLSQVTSNDYANKSVWLHE